MASSDMEVLNHELMTYIKTLELAVKSKDSTIKEQQRDISKYQAKLGSAIELAEGLSSKTDVANKTFDENLQKMNDLIDQKSNLQGQLLLVQKTRDGLTGKVSKLERENRDLVAERDELMTSVDELNIALRDTASMTELEKQQQVIGALKAELSSFRGTEDDMMEMSMKVEIVTAENGQLRDSLSRLKDLGEDAQQEIFNANDKIAEIEDRLKSANSQNTILQSQIDSMELSLSNLKTKANKAAVHSEKLQKKCDTLGEENRGLREGMSQLKVENEKSAIETDNNRLEGEVKSLKNELVAFKGKEADQKFEIESLKVVVAENERFLANAKVEWEEEKAALVGEKKVASSALSHLRAEYDANAEMYTQVLSQAQAQLLELMRFTTESRHDSRALSAGLMKLKSKVTRQCEFNLDADQNLKSELLKVFDALGDRLNTVRRPEEQEEDEEERRRGAEEMAQLRAANEALEGDVASSSAELRREKARYEQSLAESNFGIIDLKREKKELTVLLDDREEKLRSYMGQIDEGHSTIRQLEDDMEEAREAYRDLSHSTQEIIARAQQDQAPPPPPSLDEESAALIGDLEATIEEQDNKLQAYQATIEGLRRNPQRRAPPTPGGVSVEVKALAEKLSDSQEQVHALQQQKAELLEQMIEMASMQPPVPIGEEQRMSPVGDLAVSSDEEGDD